MIKDGWHKFKYFNVYLKNGCVIKAMSIGTDVTYYPYKYNHAYKCYCPCSGVKYETFRRRYCTVYRFL